MRSAARGAPAAAPHHPPTSRGGPRRLLNRLGGQLARKLASPPSARLHYPHTPPPWQLCDRCRRRPAPAGKQLLAVQDRPEGPAGRCGRDRQLIGSAGRAPCGRWSSLRGSRNPGLWGRGAPSRARIAFREILGDEDPVFCLGWAQCGAGGRVRPSVGSADAPGLSEIESPVPVGSLEKEHTLIRYHK